MVSNQLQCSWISLFQVDPQICAKKGSYNNDNNNYNNNNNYNGQPISWILLCQWNINKMKGIKKIEKYWNPACGLKMLWNMRVTVTPIIDGALGTIPYDQEKKLGILEIQGKTETIQIRILQRSSKILRKTLQTYSHWKLSKNHKLQLVWKIRW